MWTLVVTPLSLWNSLRSQESVSQTHPSTGDGGMFLALLTSSWQLCHLHRQMWHSCGPMCHLPNPSFSLGHCMGWAGHIHCRHRLVCEKRI